MAQTGRGEIRSAVANIDNTIALLQEMPRISLFEAILYRLAIRTRIPGLDAIRPEFSPGGNELHAIQPQHLENCVYVEGHTVTHNNKAEATLTTGFKELRQTGADYSLLKHKAVKRLATGFDTGKSCGI